MSKVKTKWIEDTAVTKDKLNADVAGAGLAGGAGTALNVDIQGQSAKDIPVSADLLLIEDSGDTYSKKRLLVGNLPSGAPLSDIAPVNVTKATAAQGSATAASRQDHKHDVTTAAPLAGGVVPGNTQAEGSATSLARSDHDHAVAVATPSNIGTANAAGSADSFVRSDHIHAGLNREAADFSSFAVKTLPVGNDIVLIEDSAASFAKKKVAFSNLSAGAIAYLYGYEAAVDSTTSDTYIQAFRYSPTLETATYLVVASCEVVNSSASGSVGFRVQINDSITIMEGAYEPESLDETEWLAQSCIYELAATAGVTNIDFDILQMSTGTASIRRKRVTLIKKV